METFMSGLTLIRVSERRIIEGGVEKRLRNSKNQKNQIFIILAVLRRSV